MNLNEIFPFDLSDKDKSEFFGNLNKQIADLLFDEIKSNIGYDIININYGDTYFIMQTNPNSVIDFAVKGFKSWKFGMWVNSDNLFKTELEESFYYDSVDDLPVVQVFFQHKDLIDKFKPSASTFSIELSVSAFKDYLKTGSIYTIDMHELKSMFKWVKYHPFLAYEGVKPDWYHGPDSIKRYLKSQSKEKSEYYREYIGLKVLVPYVKRKINQFEQSDIVKFAKIFNLGEGWVSSTRIEVIVRFKESTTDNEIDELVHKLLPFKTKDIWKISTYDYVLSFRFEQGDEWISYEY